MSAGAAASTAAELPAEVEKTTKSLAAVAQLRRLFGDDYEHVARALIQLLCEPRGFQTLEECVQKARVTVKELVTVLQVVVQYARAREREDVLEFCMRRRED
jgi:hypothetical protein